MQEGLIEQIRFICPRCRSAGAEGIVQSLLQLGQVFKSEGDFVLEGFLVCSNANCRSTYPILDGVPVVLKDFKSWWDFEKSGLSCVKCIACEMRDYFEALEKSESSSYAKRGLLGSYMDMHYGAPDDTPAPFASLANPEQFWETVVRMAQPETETKYNRSLDLGCSVGRYTFELARFSDLAIGIDLNFNAVSSAARVHRAKSVCYERRKRGRYFDKIHIPYSPSQNVLFLVADVLDPPFSAGSFDLVTGLNLLDNVKLPLVLIGQMDALLQSGGVLILSSPYEWRADICEPAEWLESDELDSPAMVRNILEGTMFPRIGLKFEVLQEFLNVPWALRHHSRNWSLFLVHLIKARKVHAVRKHKKRS